MFQLHFNVVSPPYMHVHGLELYQLHKLRDWEFHSSGLLRVDKVEV